MVAIKNQVRGAGIFLLGLTMFLAGCKPAGPRALLEGKSLMEKGHYAQAVEQLKIATSLLATNAQAWNYLGLANHHAGLIPDAVQAYQQALKLNHDLTEAHYNLGCLWLEQNKIEPAKSEFNAVTLRRANYIDGWTKLGQAQWRSHDIVGAEKSFNEAGKLNPQNPEVLNGLGLIAAQRNHPREAAQFFSGALKAQPNYAPALLNLAIVEHAYLGDRQLALQKYREYLAITPAPPNADAVNATAHALELQLIPVSRPPATNAVVAQAKPVTNVVIAAAQPKPEATTTIPKTTPVRATASTPAERVTMQPVVIRTSNVSTTAVVAAAAPLPLLPDQSKTPPKKGFFERLNPFHRKDETTSTLTPLPLATNNVLPKTNPAPPVTAVTATPVFARYKYRSPAKPAAGNRAAADVPFAKGNQAYQAAKYADAAIAYAQAAQLDASYFNAQYYLGLAAGQAGNLGQALLAYEYALAIQPDSADARYAFALALKKANYPVDAASELEKILADNPRDARAHLAAGGIYAQQLQQSGKAREHYQKVLEYDPNNSQATQIRYWLIDHPL